jgi:glycosyltransferase involved in cell wall biosynthesis
MRNRLRRTKILIYAPAPVGGIAEHIFYQAMALTSLGSDITCIAAQSFLPGRSMPFSCKRKLSDPVSGQASRLMRGVRQVARLVLNELRLAIEIFQTRPDLVLLDSFREYFSLIWVWPHVLLAKLAQIRYAANLHDPLRDYQIGPKWWHKLSVRLAYLPLDFVVVHQQLPQPSPVPSGVRVVEAPVGIYEVREREQDCDLRRKWGVRAGNRVFLSFGYLRNNKQLDLVLMAMVECPAVFLVVMGSPASANDHGIAFYQALASTLGVAQRTYMTQEFVADENIAAIFRASDVVLLLYAESFVSQSGVLNIAARLRRPVLASSGNGPLREAVEKYNLGIFVRPRSLPDIVRGMSVLGSSDWNTARWQEYEEYASWITNAKRIIETLVER